MNSCCNFFSIGFLDVDCLMRNKTKEQKKKEYIFSFWTIEYHKKKLNQERTQSIHFGKRKKQNYFGNIQLDVYPFHIYSQQFMLDSEPKKVKSTRQHIKELLLIIFFFVFCFFFRHFHEWMTWNQNNWILTIIASIFLILTIIFLLFVRGVSGKKKTTFNIFSLNEWNGAKAGNSSWGIFKNNIKTSIKNIHINRF